MPPTMNNCPSCQSNQLQHAHMVVASGTTNLNGTATLASVSYSDSGLGVSTGVTGFRGTQQSALAARCTPPLKRRIGVLWWLGLLIAGPSAVLGALQCLRVLLLVSSYGRGVELLIASVLATALWGYITLLLIRRRREVEKYNAEVWPGHYEEWSRSWLCHRCGYFGPV